MKIRDLQHFLDFTTIENGFMRNSRHFLLFYIYFYFQKGDFIMLPSDLLQVIMKLMLICTVIFISSACLVIALGGGE